MKRIIFIMMAVGFFTGGFAQKSQFVKLAEEFDNGEFVWELRYNGLRVGEFWPVSAINLITKHDGR